MPGLTSNARFGAASVSLAGLELRAAEWELTTAKFDLSLTAAETPAGVKLLLDYATDLFDGETVDRMAGHLAANGHQVTVYNRTASRAEEWVAKHGNASAVTPAEAAEELCYEMPLRPGDLQLLNSHVTYHARTAYEDDAASGQDRLLYRLWLSMPNSRALPPGFEVLWGRIEAGALRGGVDQV